MTIGNCSCGKKLASTWSRINNTTIKIPDVLYCRECNKFFSYEIKEININSEVENAQR